MKLLTFLCLLTSFGVTAQNLVNTPYSRFGLGESIFNGNASGFGLGRINTIVSDTNDISVANPASYSFLKPNRPIFSLGVNGNFSRFSEGSNSDIGRASGLQQLAMALPISKRVGLAFGLMPYTALGYTATSRDTIADGSDVSFRYNGSGGLNRVFMGFSVTPLLSEKHKLSLGLNTSYLFGSLSKSRVIEFENTTFTNTQVESRADIKDILFETGLVYQNKLSDRLRLHMGINFTVPANLNGVRNEIATSFLLGSAGIPVTIDTIEIINDAKGYIRLPKKFAYGVGLEFKLGDSTATSKQGRLLLMAQYAQQDWSDYREVFGSDTLNDNLDNSSRWSLGVQYQPLARGARSQIKYYQILTYRLGASYGRSFLSIDNRSIQNYGINFGVGIPLSNKNSTSMINIGGELGRRGTTENGLLQEDYFRFNVGLTLVPSVYNRWFLKRKYN